MPSLKRSAVILIALVSVAILVSAGESSAPASESKPLNYFVVVTGGELLEGVYPDAHTPFLTRTLRVLGCQCVGSITVDDHPRDLQQALRYATNHAPFVIVTGGLGPTPNDITRETLAEFTGIPLREQPDVLAELEKRFRQSRDQLRPNVRRQALVPVRGGYLKNAHGSAVGLIFDHPGSVVVALPGPPRELQAMVCHELVPYLQAHFGVREFGCSVTLRFVGAGQSLIDQTIKDHVTVAPDVVITSLFDGSRVDFTFALPGNTAADRERLKDLEGRIREHLAEYIYADDGSTLEDVVVRKLQQRGESLALVEIGSGGSLAAALAGAKESASVVAGAFVAPTVTALSRLLRVAPGQLAGLDSLEQAKNLAAAAAVQTGSQWAVCVGPAGIDAQGARSVWIACRLPANQWETVRLPLRDPGEITRSTLATQVLDFLRRHF